MNAHLYVIDGTCSNLHEVYFIAGVQTARPGHGTTTGFLDTRLHLCILQRETGMMLVSVVRSRGLPPGPT